MENMEAIKVHITPCAAEDGVLHPLFHKYEQQFDEQSAYVELDVRTGSLHADWNAEVGSGVPVDVWYGLRRRYGIISNLTTDEINTLLTELVPIAQRIVDGTDIQSDGLQDRPVLSEQAQAAEEDLEQICREECTDSGGACTAAEWFEGFFDGFDITAATTDEEIDKIALEEVKSARDELKTTVTGMVDYLTQYRDELVEEEEA